MPTYWINIADLPDPDDPGGRSYRETNEAKAHGIPVGALVELETGVRLFVVRHDRDCDMTPLYYLSADPDDAGPLRPGFKNPGWRGGFAEDSLVVIRLPGA